MGEMRSTIHEYLFYNFTLLMQPYESETNCPHLMNECERTNPSSVHGEMKSK